MYNRRITKVVVYIITILAAHFVSNFLEELIIENSRDFSVYKATVIRLIIIVFVFYPVMLLAEGYMKRLAKGYISTSKKLTKTSIYGLILGLMIATSIFFGLFLWLWYDVNVVTDFN